MDSDFLQKSLQIATQASLEAGDILRKHFHSGVEIQLKGAGDLVTKADLESEKLIRKILQKTFPSHQILGEESGHDRADNSEYLWVIDPLDGTINFAHQLPLFAVSIALLRFAQPVVGVIYDPIRNELFQSTRGYGATLNGKKIRVSSTTDLSKSLLATGFAYHSNTTHDAFFHLTHFTHGVRRLGASALDLAHVAGRCLISHRSRRESIGLRYLSTQAGSGSPFIQQWEYS